MKCSNQIFNKYALLYGACLFSSLMSTAIVSQAADVVLNPGFISGDVQIGNLPITTMHVQARNGLEFSSINVHNSNRYTITVNTGEAGNATYTVSINANMGQDSMQFEGQSVVVNAGAASELDFVVDPGFIQGQVTVNGAGLTSGYLQAHLNDASGFSVASTSFGSDGSFHFPVQANDNIRLTGLAYTDNGAAYTLNGGFVNVAVGQTITENFEITVTPQATGIMSGVLDIPGQQVDKYFVTGRKNIGGLREQYTQYESGPYSLDLESGTWLFQVFADLNNFDDYMRLPFSYFIGQAATTIETVIIADSTVMFGTPVDTSFINGQISLTGSASNEMLTDGYMNVRGIGDDSSTGLGGAGGGRSRDRISADGTYDLVATPGEWIFQSMNLIIRDPETASLQFDETINMGTMPINRPVLIKDETINIDHDFQTGSLTFNFQNLGGQLFSFPRVAASCKKKNPDFTTEYQYSVNANGRQTDVATAQIKVIALVGTCDFRATAVVGGSNTTFSRFTADILPGTDVVIDLGAPTLSISKPEPEAFTVDSMTEVSGIITDANGIASLSVNNVDVSFSSTNNPQDSNEVAFSTEVLLANGENDIAVAVTDTLGNTLTETRNVYRDGADPTLSWSPVDGAVVDTETILIAGTATDDTGVEKVTINGQELVLTSTNNPSDANEVSFSTTLTLATGANPVFITVTDLANRLVGETHIITLSAGNEAPIANAGMDQLLECSGALTTVNLDGSASSDADNDPLSYAWAGSFGAASGVNAAVQLALGTHLIDLTVDDGILSAMDQLSVVLQDTIAPVITLGANVTLEATSLNGAGHDLGVMVDDLCGTASYAITPNLASYPLGKTTVIVDANDDSQNTSTASIVIDVVDTTAPELSVPADVTVIAAGSLTAVDLGVAAATDIFDVTVSNNLPAEGLTIGAHDITWTATDANGNVSTAIQQVYVQYDFCGGFMQPLVEGKAYKRRNTLPVKFQLCYADGSLVSDANATLSVQQLSNGEPAGDPLEITSTSNADTGSNFRLSSDKYIYNLEISAIAAGSYRLSVNLNDGSALKTIDIGLK